ncbi:hypothetical protein FB45DRAFT_803729 [Roridomyces roridus]|uniref:DUF6699 domain-containing protein n=1 Tax=Roridomyces roridus TaxID=1738132 RepID=A0AAD7FCZ7_9AGAR|nr:hypothetical protein FB45DRAFT_803729 [Roridomyces roridus]
MTSPAITPFIPPLGTPGPSPNPVHAPQLPQAPTGNTAYPAWASAPQGAGNYPVYPSTPYTAPAGTPYIPASSNLGPGYFQGTGPPQPSMPLPPTYGGGAYTPFAGAGAAAASGWGAPGAPWPGMAGGGPPPGTPWHGPPAPPQHMGTPWMGGGAGFPSPYAPAGAPPVMPPTFGPPPAGRPQAWGGPAHPMAAFTPAAAADPWGAQMQQQVPPWAQAQMMGGMPGMGMGQGMPGGMGQGMPGMGMGMGQGMMGGLGLGYGAFGGPVEQVPLSRSIGQVGDRMPEFTEGPNYGPVLEPFLIRAVHAHVRLNPLIQPLVEADDRPYLKWNMLFAPNQCQRSDDAPHLSWSQGRGEPATFPRVTQISLVSETIPWLISITARNRDIGVTCGEVIDYISRNMFMLTGQSEFESLPRTRREPIARAYRHNRSTARGVPGGQLGPGMLRLDWLGLDTMFGGVRENERVVRRVCHDLLPCTFELVCVRRYPMNEEEIRNQEALNRQLGRDREERRRSRHRPTVASVRDDEESGEEEDSE